MGFPIPKFGSWATEAVFPGTIGSTPWAAQPCKVAPVGDLWVPGVKPPAENENYILNLVGVDHTALCNLATSAGLNNWGGFVSPSVAWVSMADDGTGRWVALDAGLMVDSQDGGRTWGNVVTIAGVTTLCITTDGLSNSFYLTASGTNLVATLYAGRTLVSSVPTSTISVTDAVAEFDPNITGTEGWLGYVISQSGGTLTGRLFLFQLAGSSTITGQTIPAAWTTATNHSGALFMARNGTTTYIARGGATAGTDTPGLLKCVVSSNSYTCTDVTPAILTGQIITGFDWCPGLGLYGIMAYDGTTSHFYTSPDGVTWTLAHIFTAIKVTQLVAVGLTFVTCVPDPYTGTGIGVSISQDSGTTWHQTCITHTGTVKLYKGNSQVAVVYGSVNMAMSARVGLA